MSNHNPKDVEDLEDLIPHDTDTTSGSPPDIDVETETSQHKEAKLLDVEDFDPEKLQEETRTQLAKGLISILTATLLGVAAYIFVPIFTTSFLSITKSFKESSGTAQNSKPSPQPINKIPVVEVKKDVYLVILPEEESASSKEEKSNGDGKELITLIWTSQVTLVSGALGFYFGSKRNG